MSRTKNFQDIDETYIPVERAISGKQISSAYAKNVSIQDWIPPEVQIKSSGMANATLMMVDIDNMVRAPEELDFFHEQSDKIVIELASSMEQDGQFSPVILREIKAEDSSIQWQILAGKTRCKAATYLRDNGKDAWQKLHAYTFPLGTCDDITAQRIIIHTNTQGRSGKSLTPEEKLKCFSWQYVDAKGEQSNISAAKLTSLLMERYGIKRSQAFTYRQIADNLLPGFMEQLRVSDLTISEATILASLNEEVQKYLMDDKESFQNLDLKKIKKDAKKKTPEEIIRDLKESKQKTSVPIFEELEEKDGQLTVKVTIPSQARESFIKTVYRLQHKYDSSVYL